jgi:hypothetical protein
MFEYPEIHEIRSASDLLHPASTPGNPITAAYVLVIRDRNPEAYIGDEFWTGTTSSGGAGAGRFPESFAWH